MNQFPQSNNPSVGYSPENLRTLIDGSETYAALPAEEKAKIQEHIKLNNKPVLIYIYQKLLEESASLEISREQLSKKILGTSPSDQNNIHDDLKKI